MPNDEIQDISEFNPDDPQAYSPSITASPNAMPVKPNVPKLSPARRSNVPEARGARAESTSVQDFADFIKSTGPPEPPKQDESTFRNGVRANGSSVAAASIKSGAPSRRPFSPTSVTSKARTVVPPGSSRSQRTERLQARPAAARNDARTAELIDFLREGPPEEKPRAGGRRSSAAANGTDQSNSSKKGFFRNSTTTKPPATARTAPGTGGGGGAPQPFDSPDPGLNKNNPMPARKQRRVKDPYAIDLDSDEELEAFLQPRGKKVEREEESLVDFLRNCPPPPADEPPQLLSVNTSVAAGGSKPRSKSTASSVKSRLIRTSSAMDKKPSNKVSRSSLRSYKSNATAPIATSTSPTVPALPEVSTASPAFGRTNTQINNYIANKHAGTGGNGHMGHISRPQIGAVTPKPNPRLPIDDVRTRDTGTSALADFLKNTGPPEPPPGFQSSASSLNEKDNSNSFSRMFLRRKKQAV